MIRDFIAVLRGRLFLLRCRISRKRVQIGDGLKVYKKLDIRGKGKVIIGKNCTIAGIRGDIGRFVTLYTHSEDATITIGNDVSLFAARISCRFSIHIGNGVLIEDSGILDTDFHTIDRDRGPNPTETKAACQVIIGDRVAIGARSIVGKGVIFGADSVVAPGSVVTKSLPARCFALGNPAKPIGSGMFLCANVTGQPYKRGGERGDHRR
jgi:acetyltransferase-like isoleucine patch superfamily enzyme